MLYLVAKASHVGADVDGLAYSLHRPTACDCQTRGQRPLTDVAPIYLITKLLQKVLVPMPVHTLPLLGKGTESPDRHRPVQSP
jgi:hypothetical protein